MARKILFFSILLMIFGNIYWARADKPVLTVYTYDSFTAEWGPGPAVEKAFEATCQCDLQLIGLESSLAITARLRLEGKNTSADVILGLDTASQGDLATSGLLQPHGLAEDVKGRLTLPYAWQDEVFLPFDYGYFAFIYDKRRISSPPQSLAELVENKDGLNIAFSDARFSTPGWGLVLWMKHVYGDEAAAAWRKLTPYIVAVPPSWSVAYKMFLDEEVDMVLSYTTSPAYHIIAEEDDNYAAANFAEGHYMQIETAAMTEAANSVLAQEFLRFMLSDEFQSLIPTGNWMYPVTDVELPSAFAAPPKPLLFLSEEIAANRRAWLAEWQDAIAP